MWASHPQCCSTFRHLCLGRVRLQAETALWSHVHVIVIIVVQDYSWSQISPLTWLDRDGVGARPLRWVSVLFWVWWFYLSVDGFIFCTRWRCTTVRLPPPCSAATTPSATRSVLPQICPSIWQEQLLLLGLHLKQCKGEIPNRQELNALKSMKCSAIPAGCLTNWPRCVIKGGARPSVLLRRTSREKNRSRRKGGFIWQTTTCVVLFRVV